MKSGKRAVAHPIRFAAWFFFALPITLNLIGMIVIVFIMYLLGASAWDIDLGSMPDWAKPP